VNRVRWSTAGGALGLCVATALASIVGGTPLAQAKNGDTHITGVGVQKTIDCDGSTLFVNGSANVITALGSCWGVTIQGSANTVIADNVVNDITVYGWNQTALFKTGEPALVDRGRELGMTNRLDRIPG
jgi:Protein of unknown function (DUF3060)